MTVTWNVFGSLPVLKSSNFGDKTNYILQFSIDLLLIQVTKEKDNDYSLKHEGLSFVSSYSCGLLVS